MIFRRKDKSVPGLSAFRIEVRAKSFHVPGYELGELSNDNSVEMSDFGNDDEINDFISENFDPWADGGYAPIYGGADETLSFRQTNPFGQFQEGQEVDNLSENGFTDVLLHRENNDFSFRMVVRFEVEVHAESEDVARDFTLENLQKCFLIEDFSSRDKVKIEHVEIGHVEKIS